MYSIFKNFLSEEEIKSITKPPFNPFSTKWFNTPKRLYQEKILATASKCFDLSSMVGFEEWHHDPFWRSLPSEHYDKDEVLYQETEETVFPLCSCIYYFKIEGLVGASLVIDDKDTIVPESNMLVVMSPGVWHKVTEYETGTRVSLNINPWDYKIKIS